MIERLGRYRIVRPLGEGGMGRVFEAELEGPAGFRKRVAVKVLKAGHGDGLAREARLGGLLRHPNLVEVYALERVDDQWFVAMELIEGGSLASVAPLPPRAVIEVGLQVCAGLEHAHRAIGLVHLDLKPSNLLLDGGVVKIADLGVARARGFEGDGVRGTPAYMAPEQAAGDPVDARADVWALGLVLYELATGFRTLNRSPATWSTVHEPTMPGRPELLTTGIEWLVPILDRSVAWDPNQRFPSAAAMAEALRAIDVSGPALSEAVGRPDWELTETLDAESEASTNLAAPVDRFVGREAERIELEDRLHGHRLVTLKGIGGLGKTRLAREFGWQWHLDRRRPVWFCDLSEARSPLELVGAVAAVLGIPLDRGEPDALAVRIGHALDGRGILLLVLDNAEQVRGAAAILSRWMGLAPELRVLVTSREPLRVRGEQVIELQPLPVGEATELLMARVEARGRSVEPDAALRELARRLDGLPLALELAAGRLGVMTARQVLDRLDRRLDLLQNRQPDAPGRQATLRGMVDWSWELLSAHERAALAQLTVFRGGFGLEAAEAVLELGPGAPWAMDLVEQLVERSLLVAASGPDGPRFSMFETVHAFAAEALSEADRRAAEARHAAWYARMGTEEALHELDLREGTQQRRALVAEIENLAAGVDRAVEAGELADALGCLAAAWEVWSRNGPHQAVVEPCRRVMALSEGAAPGLRAEALLRWSQALGAVGDKGEAIALAERAIQEAPDDPARLRALIQLLVLQGGVGELEAAARNHPVALELARLLGDRRREAIALSMIGLSRMQRGQLAEGRPLLEEALAIHRSVGNRRSEAVVGGQLGILAYEEGRLTDSVAQLQRALALARELGDRSRAAVLLQNLGQAHFELGQIEAARARFAAARATQREVGLLRSESIVAISQATLELRTGDRAVARRLFHEGIALTQRAGNRVWEAIGIGWLGVMAWLEGDNREAEARLDQAVGMLAGRFAQARGFFEAHLGAALHPSDPERGAATLGGAVGALRDGGYAPDLIRALTLRARVLGRSEDLDEARALCDRMQLPPEAPLRLGIEAVARGERQPGIT